MRDRAGCLAHVVQGFGTRHVPGVVIHHRQILVSGVVLDNRIWRLVADKAFNRRAPAPMRSEFDGLGIIPRRACGILDPATYPRSGRAGCLCRGKHSVLRPSAHTDGFEIMDDVWTGY